MLQQGEVIEGYAADVRKGSAFPKRAYSLSEATPPGPIPRRSLIKTDFTARKGKAFPHIGRQSRARMIDIINRQRARKISAQSLRVFVARSLNLVERESRDVSIVFVSDPTIKKLNRQFRGKDFATDVLSFPNQAEPFESQNEKALGEIVISVDRAAAQAKENGLSFSNEVAQLILHGLLHLCGYDHETDTGEMNRLELKLRKRLGI